MVLITEVFSKRWHYFWFSILGEVGDAIPGTSIWSFLIIIPQVALLVKNPPANAGDIRDAGLIPGLGRYPGESHGNPLQYSCPENPMDRGAWRVTVHGVAKSQTRLTQLSMRASTHDKVERPQAWVLKKTDLCIAALSLIVTFVTPLNFLDIFCL